MNLITQFFSALYNSLVNYSYRRKGYRDCRLYDVKIDTNNIKSTRDHFKKIKDIVDAGNPNKHAVFKALEEGLLNKMKRSLLSLNNKYKSYIINSLEDKEQIIATQNARTGTIQKYFDKLSVERQSNNSRQRHIGFIILLLGIDAIVTKGVFTDMFGELLEPYEINIVMVGVFIIVLTTLLIKLGAYYKKQGRWRWPATIPFIVVFALLTVARVSSIAINVAKAETLDTSSEKFGAIIIENFATIQDNLAFKGYVMGIIFLTIYCLTGFLAVYLSYRDTYKDNAALCRSLDQEYSLREQISNNFERWPALMDTKVQAYRKGWGQRVERNEQKLEEKVRKVGGDSYVL